MDEIKEMGAMRFFKALCEMIWWKEGKYLKVAFSYLSISVPNIPMCLFIFFYEFQIMNVHYLHPFKKNSMENVDIKEDTFALTCEFY